MKRISIIAILIAALSLMALPSLASSSEDNPQPAFTDGRLNNFDIAAPVAIFPVEDGDAIGLDFWTPTGYEGAGELALRVTAEELAAVESSPEEAQLVAASEDGLVTLWRLPDGVWQVLANAGTSGTYSIVFESLGINEGYSSDWLK